MGPLNWSPIIDDLEEDWRLLDDKKYLDYVHARELTLAISDWPRLLRQTIE